MIGRRRSRPNAFGLILMPGRRLAALVLGAVDQPRSPRSTTSLGQAAADQLLAALVLLDVGLEDRVEHVVGRQRVLVALVRLAARPRAARSMIDGGISSAPDGCELRYSREPVDPASSARP